jgi:hypothetical protein
MTILDLPEVTTSDGTSVLSWMQSVADRNQPNDVAPTIIPVAWMGRTSTDDQQDRPCRCHVNWRTPAGPCPRRS